MSTTINMLERAQQLQSDIVAMRRHLHQHPELSFQEFETSKLAAEQLSKLGYKVRTGIARTGVIGELGQGGKLIAIRADMDGLPIQETTGAPYQSKNDGVMHACGHDAHVSCAIAAARLLADDKLPGRLRFLMQPAEENGDEESVSGAKRMIQQGAMDGVDAVIGLHMDASVPAGKVAVMTGPVMAAADTFKIVIKGKGGHGAYPETTVDSVVIAAQVIQAAQQVVSRRISALEPAIVTIGSIHSSSSRGNVISEEVVLQGTIRSFKEPIRQQLIAELEKVCQISRSLGGDYEIEYELGYPATVNDGKIADVMREAAIDLIGEENVLTIPLKTWSEDFSMLAEVSPGAFMFLGGEITGDRRSHHSPNFDLNESGLFIGPAILAETARRLMRSAG
jgi:amidohydrolase